MAPSVLTAAVADIAPATGGHTTQHAMAISHLSADEMDATFSPLSSSTITITSLGSSLGFSTSGAKSGARKGVSRHALSKGSDVLESDDSDNDDSDCKEGKACPNDKDGQGGRGMAANLHSYSSANISTAAESTASSASQKSSSLELPRVMMRSVSVDHTRAYGLHMLHSDVAKPSTETAASAADSANTEAELDVEAPTSATAAPALERETSLAPS
ncbi:hypothetical protein IWW50_006686, partial [Coemansia erecta]